MGSISRRADFFLLYLPLFILAGIYSVTTGEWWALAALAGAAVGVSFTISIDDYYGGTTTPVERFVLAFEHLLALGLLILMILLSPRMLDGSPVAVILWIVIVSSLVAYFARAGLAWRRFRHAGETG